MNTNKFLESTLKAIDEMTIEEFEEVCLEHGYRPVRKQAKFKHSTIVYSYVYLKGK